MGNLTFVWVGWGKLNRKCKVSNVFLFFCFFFFLSPKSLTDINTRLDDMEEFKGRDTAISSVTGFFLLVTVKGTKSVILVE